MQFITTGVESLSRRISLAGLMSRSEAEKAIKAGIVAVDGALVSSMQKVADTSSVTVNGTPVPPPPPVPLLYGLIKPRGVMCEFTRTSHLSEGKCFLPDLLARWDKRSHRQLGPRSQSELSDPTLGHTGLTPVGLHHKHFVVINRIPTTATGLVLLTHDGSFAKSLTDPDSRVLTTFRVRTGNVSDTQIDQMKKWKAGVSVGGVFYGQVFVDVEKRTPTQTWLLTRLIDAPGRSLNDLFWYRANAHVNRVNCYAFGPYRASDVPEGQLLQLPIDKSIQHLIPKREIKPTLIKR